MCVDEFFHSGLMGWAILTKNSYARDALYFFEYAVNVAGLFPDKDVKDIDYPDLAQITPQDIDNYLSWMEDGQGLSSRTIARRKAAISVMFEYLVNTERKLSYNPVAGAQKIDVVQSEFVTYLKMDEQEKLLDCM